jgi:hypothetical protein
VDRLENYRMALQTLEQPGAKNAQYFLITLDAEAKQLSVKSYGAGPVQRRAVQQEVRGRRARK